MNRNGKIARKFFNERESKRRFIAFTHGMNYDECSFRSVPKNRRKR